MLHFQVSGFQVTTDFALNHVKLKLKPGEIFALIGKSGSGKSTLAKLICGETLDPKAVIAWNQEAWNLEPERLIRQFPQVGYVPQVLKLKPHHRVRDYLAYLFQFESDKKAQQLIKKEVKRFGLGHCLEQKIEELSGGERQKLAIMEALVRPIKVLVLDEPFSQLDLAQKMELSNLIKDLVHSRRLACLLISHDFSDVWRLCDRLGMMEKGKMIFQGNLERWMQSKKAPILRQKQALAQWLDELSGLF